MDVEHTGSCPCGSGDAYERCCGPIHAGTRAPTAERVMRARYSAYALGDVDFLMRSWHPDTRPSAVDLERTEVWRGLEIIAVSGGGMLDRVGTVEFVARYTEGARTGELHEVSLFERVEGEWVYVDPDEASVLSEGT